MKHWIHEFLVVVLVVLTLSATRFILMPQSENPSYSVPVAKQVKVEVEFSDKGLGSRGQKNEWLLEPNSIHSDYPHGAKGNYASKLDVNRATAQELETLKGIGEVLAKRIIEDRESNGYYLKGGDLVRVKGIGPKKLDGFINDISP